MLLPFARWLALGYACVPVARRGYPVTPGSKLTPEKLGKVPTLKTAGGLYYGFPWTAADLATDEDAARWDRWHAGQPLNLCVRTGVGEKKVGGLDLDIPAGGPISAAEIRALALARLGPAPTRRGNGEKVLLAYRTEDDIAKHRLAWGVGKDENGKDIKHATEWIGRGNQFVAFGQHPAGMMYEWDGEWPAGELTVVSLTQLESFLSEVEQLLRSRGIEPESRSASSADRSQIDPASLLAPSDEVLAELLSKLEVDPTYDGWFRVLVAIYGAVRDKARGRELAVQYSTLNPEEGGEKYDTISAPVSLGFDYLKWVAREQGINTAAFDFEVIEPDAEPATPAPTLIEQANAEFALVLSRPGQVLWRRPGKPPAFPPIQHWRTMMRALPMMQVGDRFVVFANWWLSHPKRLLLEDVVIDPTRAPLSLVETPDGLVFNQWPGFATQPSADGADDLIVGFFRDVICSSNEEHFQYVMMWLASVVQAPERLPGTALVLLGGQGIGKSTAGDIMRRIVGDPLTLLEEKGRRLVGDFNASIEGKVLGLFEEALFAGDRGTYGALKHLITSPSITVEAKYEHPRVVHNMLHVMMMSNERWAVPASQSERRFTVLEVSTCHQQDRPYFTALRDQLDSGGAERFMYRLLNEVTIDWPLLARPLRTQALLDQQLDSMSGLDRWWLGCLQTGLLPGGSSAPLTDDVHTSIRHSLGDKYEANRATETRIGQLVKGLGAVKKRSRTGGGRPYRYHFPPLAECRAAFARGLAMTPDWDDVDEWLPAKPIDGGAL